MQNTKVSGIIVRMTPYSEFDRVLGIFTEEYGVISVYAKGVRRARSRRSPHIDLLNDVTAELEEITTGGEPRRYLREIHATATFAGLKKDPFSFSAACLIAYFIKRTVPENAAQPELLQLTRDSYAALGDSTKNMREILKTFFLKAISMLGLIPPTMREADLSETLWTALTELDPQFTLHARRTLGIFSKADNTFSS